MIYGERCTGPSKASFFPRQSVSGSLSERSVTPALSSVNWFHGLEFFSDSDKLLTMSEFRTQWERRILYEENEKRLYRHSSIVLNILSTVYRVFVDLWLVKKSKETNFQGNILQKSIWSLARCRTDKKVSSKLVEILSSFDKVIIWKKMSREPANISTNRLVHFDVAVGRLLPVLFTRHRSSSFISFSNSLSFFFFNLARTRIY